MEVITKEQYQEEILPTRLSLIDRKQIIRKYLEGTSKQDIAKEYGISTRGVTTVLENNHDIRTQTEKRYLATALSRENYRLSETKNKLIDFVDYTLEELAKDPESMTPDKRITVLNQVAALFDKLSLASRLNQDKATDISETRQINVDIAKIIEQLPTAEDKLNFLRKQKPNTSVASNENNV